MEQSIGLWNAVNARPSEHEGIGMAEIGEPERRRVLVPDEAPIRTPVIPEPKSPVKVPKREPA